MSSSFVYRGERGFWCPDALLEPFAYLLGRALERRPEPWARDIGAEMVGKSRAGLSGCLDLGINTLSDAQLPVVASAVEALVSTVVKEASLLSASALNGAALATRYSEPVSVSAFQSLGNIFLALLCGAWGSSSSDDEAMPDHWLHKPLP